MFWLYDNIKTFNSLQIAIGTTDVYLKGKPFMGKFWDKHTRKAPEGQKDGIVNYVISKLFFFTPKNCVYIHIFYN